MSTNRDYAWMLRDEEGNRMGVNPDAGVEVRSIDGAQIRINGEVVASLDALHSSDIRNSNIYTLGGAEPINWGVIQSGTLRTNDTWSTLVSGQWSQGETIVDSLSAEKQAYIERYRREPAGLIMRTDVYRQLCEENRERNLASFEGVTIICTQRLVRRWDFVGTAEQEAFER